MPSSRKSTGKVAGALLLVSMIAYEICGYPTISSEGEVDYEPGGLRAVIEELERQGLTGRIVPRAFGSSNVIIRKSVGPSDFRLRFGKRSVFPTKVQQQVGPSRQLLNWQETSSSLRND